MRDDDLLHERAAVERRRRVEALRRIEQRLSDTVRALVEAEHRLEHLEADPDVPDDAPHDGSGNRPL